MKIKGKQFNKILTHYGNADYYKFYKSRYIKSGDELFMVSNSTYNQILSEFNQIIVEAILDKGLEFKLPHNLGSIAIRKYKPVIRLDKNGNIEKNCLPINPIETKKLWEANPEAKEKKMVVRFTNKHSDGFVFKIAYFKKKAKFKNKSVYHFSFKRSFKRMLSFRVKEKSIDAFLI